MGQCSTLDSMVDRLSPLEYLDFEKAVGKFYGWGDEAVEIPSMSTTLFYDPSKKSDPKAAPKATQHDVEETTLYLDEPRSCLKFHRNHFKHAKVDLLLQRIDASLSLNFEIFLPKILRDIVKDFKAPSTFDIVTLLGDHVSDLKRKREVLDAESEKNAVAVENPVEVHAPPTKRPKIVISFHKK